MNSVSSTPIRSPSEKKHGPSKTQLRKQKLVFALCCQKIIDDFLKFRENLLTDLNWSVKRICGPSQGAKVIVNLQRFAE